MASRISSTSAAAAGSPPFFGRDAADLLGRADTGLVADALAEAGLAGSATLGNLPGVRDLLTCVGVDVPVEGGVATAARERLIEVAKSSAISAPEAPVSGARIDAGLFIAMLSALSLFPACAARVVRQSRVLGAEGPMPGPRALPFSILTRARRLVRRNELMLAAADEIGPAHAPQRLAQHRPIVGIVIAQERLVEPAHLQALGHPDLAARAAQSLQR